MSSLTRLYFLSFAIFMVKFLYFLAFYPSLILLVESTSSNINLDKDALISIKSKLSFEPSNPLSSWDRNLSPCNWTRVVCDQFGERVIGLNLSNLELVGSISPHVGNLSLLQFLYLQNNQLSGPIPMEISNLVHLRFLNLSSNNLDGSIPSNNISMLGGLEVIDLMMNKIVGRIPRELSFLPRLRVLNLRQNLLSGPIPPSISNISSLNELNLGTNTLSGPIPSDLSKLRSLKLLDVSINNLTGLFPTPIYNMSSLEYLIVASNQLWGELPYDVGQRLPNLLAFNFCINKFTGRIPGSLHNLTNIHLIRMSHNLLHGNIPPGLGKLTSLTMYNIGYNNIVSSGDNWLDFITSLANSTKLNFLAFDGNLIEGMIPDSIGNLSKVLSYLYMGQNRLYGSIPRSIGQLTNLALLNMSYNEFKGSIPSEISQLKGLQVLNLAKNHLSGGIPEGLGNLGKLNNLDLSSNDLVGKVPTSLEGLTSLISLDLSSNKFNGSIPKEILNFPSFSTTLNLSNNLFDGQLPEEIGTLQLAIAIDLSNNQLSGNIPSSISKCKSLQILNMARNSFLGPIPGSLGSLTALTTLDLSHNQLSGFIPQDLQHLGAIQSLNLSFNDLQGASPCGGVFSNLSRVQLQGNPKLFVHLSCQNTRGAHDHKATKVAIIIVIVLALALCFIVSAYFYITSKRKSKQSKTTDLIAKEQHQMLKYDELRQATRDFNEANLVGQGSFGLVYKGILRDRTMAAIKVLNMKMDASWKSFMTECEALRNVRHRNLVKLITSCSSLDGKNMEFLALVYEFMVNGSLEDWIKGKKKRENEDGLNFEERLNAAIDIASALDYLHHDCQVPIVHCDIKPSNILLDQDMNAKLGDFGLARLLMQSISDQHSISSSHVLKGSIGYMPPEYGLGVRPSTAGDTYSFGVTLLELFTGKKPSHEIFMTANQSLIEWVQKEFPSQVMQVLLDPELLQLQHEADILDTQLDCIVTVFEIGLSCTVTHPDARITMRVALQRLKAVREKFLKS